MGRPVSVVAVALWEGEWELSFRHDGRQTCFRSTRMGVDMEPTAPELADMLDSKVESGVLKKGQENFSAKVWFIGLVIGGVKTDPGPQVRQVKVDQILAYVRNQEKESKVIKQMFECHKQEMSEMRKGSDALGLKFDQLSEILIEMMNDCSHIM
jgi:hypothetical protein